MRKINLKPKFDNQVPQNGALHCDCIFCKIVQKPKLRIRVSWNIHSFQIHWFSDSFMCFMCSWRVCFPPRTHAVAATMQWIMMGPPPFPASTKESISSANLNWQRAEQGKRNRNHQGQPPNIEPQSFNMSTAKQNANQKNQATSNPTFRFGTSSLGWREECTKMMLQSQSMHPASSS